MSMECSSEPGRSSSSSEKMTVIIAEIVGLFSLLLKVKREEWKELERDGPEWSDDGEAGETETSGEMRRGTGPLLPLTPPPCA